MIFLLQRVPPAISFGNTEAVLNHTYGQTDRYLTKDGEPYLYIMGELHYSRVDEKQWEERLKRMKEAGIEIVSSYIIWNHHEEEEGVFDFSGRRDLRRFVQLCERLGLLFFLRIGPWAHGEARNGGFPDWLNKACENGTRRIAYPYLDYVERLFRRVYDEIGQCPNLIGIQVENELTKRPAYLETLHRMLKDIGFRVPYWSATAWGGAELPPDLLRMYGWYPEAPWAQHTNPIYNNEAYRLTRQRADNMVGNDVLTDSFPAENGVAKRQYPFLSCEEGSGNQITYHRRPLIGADDVLSIAVSKLGSGLNGLGYYMFCGGENPRGKYSDMQESRASGSRNDYPIRSYDFDAPIGDSGGLRQSFFRFRELHRFVRSFGKRLAPMQVFLPEEDPSAQKDEASLACAVRSDGITGYFFFNNHARLKTKPSVKEKITVTDYNGISFDFELSAASDAFGVFPIRLTIGSTRFRCVTAMPVEEQKGSMTFVPIKGLAPIIVTEDGRRIPFEGTVTIGDAELRLEKPSEVTASPEYALPYTCRAVNLLSHRDFLHLDYRDNPADRTIEYEFTVPRCATYLLLRVMGCAAALYDGDELLSDRYPDGSVWHADVRERREKMLTLKILPLTAEDQKGIYWETCDGAVLPCGGQEPVVSIHYTDADPLILPDTPSAVVYV